MNVSLKSSSSYSAKELPAFEGELIDSTTEKVQKHVSPLFAKNKLRNDKWSKKEEEKLKMLLSSSTVAYSNPWTPYDIYYTNEVKHFFPTRTAKQINEKWKQQLSPYIISTTIQEEDVEALTKLHNQYSNKWATISRNFFKTINGVVKYYPDNAIKNYFLKKQKNSDYELKKRKKEAFDLAEACQDVGDDFDAFLDRSNESSHDFENLLKKYKDEDF